MPPRNCKVLSKMHPGSSLILQQRNTYFGQELHLQRTSYMHTKERIQGGMRALRSGALVALPKHACHNKQTTIALRKLPTAGAGQPTLLKSWPCCLAFAGPAPVLCGEPLPLRSVRSGSSHEAPALHAAAAGEEDGGGGRAGPVAALLLWLLRWRRCRQWCGTGSQEAV